MKIFLLVLLFIIFVMIAVFIYFKYYFRLVLFKDMVYICKYFKNQISFNKNNIKKITEDVLSKVSAFTRHIVLNSRDGNKIWLINNKDKNLVNDFFLSLGHGDVSFEISNIEYYDSTFCELKSVSKENLNKEGKMYFKLIIGLGLALCIILI